MGPLARYHTVTRVRLIWNTRHFAPRRRPGARGVRFSRGWRTRVARAMRLALAVRTAVIL